MHRFIKSIFLHGSMLLEKKAFYEAHSRGWHQNFVLVHVSGSRVAELEMHLLAAKVNYCTQQVADLTTPFK